MKPTPLFALVALAAFSPPSHAGVEFWNSNLVWGGQGICSAEFTFDSGAEAVTNLELAFDLRDPSGEVVASDRMRVEAFGQSGASRYGQAIAESRHLCDDSLKLVVTRAVAVMQGEPVDLLEAGQIAARAFVPIAISIGRVPDAAGK